MNITIKINTDNAAFDPLPELEIGRILGLLAERMTRAEILLFIGRDETLRDLNGNPVGDFTIRG